MIVVGVALVAAAGAGFVVGALFEHLRSGGSRWQRTENLRLAKDTAVSRRACGVRSLPARTAR